MGSDSKITVSRSICWPTECGKRRGAVEYDFSLYKFCRLLFFKQLHINDFLNGKTLGGVLGTLECYHKVVFPQCHLGTPALSASLLLTILKFFCFFFFSWCFSLNSTHHFLHLFFSCSLLLTLVKKKKQHLKFQC